MVLRSSLRRPAKGPSRPVDTTHVVRLSLEYPNGRSHLIDYDGDLRFKPGDTFELHGRTWRVTGEAPRSRYTATRTVVCRPITASPLTKIDADHDT